MVSSLPFWGRFLFTDWGLEPFYSRNVCFFEAGLTILYRGWIDHFIQMGAMVFGDLKMVFGDLNMVFGDLKIVFGDLRMVFAE